MTHPADIPASRAARRLATVPPRPARPRNRVGAVSLGGAIAGAAMCRIALATAPLAGAPWLEVMAAGFEAAIVGGLADWFAVTALFRHPLGLPIPHTAIIPARRDKIIERIVSMVQDEWLSPDVIAARLERVTPSALVVDWLRDPGHVARIGGPLRDLLRGAARTLTEEEVVDFVDRQIQRQLGAPAVGDWLAEWLARAARGETPSATFASLAVSLANVADRPRTASELQALLDQVARGLRRHGKRAVPFFLRRRLVQRKVVEALCTYASTELREAASNPSHPLHAWFVTAVRRFADRLAAGEPDALAQVERVRATVVEALEARPIVRTTLGHLRAQLERDLEDPRSALSGLLDRKLREAVLEALEASDRRAAFDAWVRTTARDLVRRHHDQIGLTVRENLEALETDELVAQIEERVGDDLQYIRLNGAVVGGLIGLALAGVRLLTH